MSEQMPEGRGGRGYEADQRLGSSWPGPGLDVIELGMGLTGAETESWTEVEIPPSF